MSVATRQGPLRAITFVVNRRGARYAPRLDLDRVARHVATATGPLGSCLEYLDHTLAALEALGLDDPMLREVRRRCAAPAEPAPAGPALAGSTTAGSTRAEPLPAEPARTESTAAEPAPAEPALAESTAAEPPRAEAARSC